MFRIILKVTCNFIFETQMAIEIAALCKHFLFYYFVILRTAIISIITFSYYKKSTSQHNVFFHKDQSTE